jgi:hypothetical protein
VRLRTALASALGFLWIPIGFFVRLFCVAEHLFGYILAGFFDAQPGPDRQQAQKTKTARIGF